MSTCEEYVLDELKEFKRIAKNQTEELKRLDAKISELQEVIDAIGCVAKMGNNSFGNYVHIDSSAALSGEKFSTARVSISYTHSTSTEVDGEFVTWAKEHAPELLTVKEPEANRVAIKAYIKNNGELEHAHLVEKESLKIK